jgi:hypothetical protein
MTFAAAIVAMTLGQPPVVTPGADYYPLNSRTIKIPIKYEKDRKTIRQVKLYVARNGENTWYQEAIATPDRDAFTYVAKEDGIYWFTMQEEDIQGRNIPADLTRHPPDLKVVVDTIQPRVQFTNARRSGEEVIVEWFVDDKHPDENSTRVHFRPASHDGYWQEVTLPANSKSGVRFPSGTTGPVIVRVTAVDIAGNKTEATREIAGATSSAVAQQTSTSLSPQSPTAPLGVGAQSSGQTTLPATPAGGVIPPPINLTTHGATSSTVGNSPDSNSNPISPASPIMPTAPTQMNALPLANNEPRPPASPQGATPSVNPTPVPVWSGPSNTYSPTVELSRAQAINCLTFDLGYELETRGPSGISRVDLWVTRDEGRTWLKWSQHDGKNSTLRVNLNVPANPQPEGVYGFRLVPISGAGLSEREPTGGDAPELRVIVDTTPPQVDLFPPVGDPANPDTLVIQWKATDRNFGEEPITIEWSEKPTGPWQPVATAELVQIGTIAGPQPRRLPNTGQYAWRVPAGLPPRVYLKITARDIAGNVKEAITRDPILVDLVKPRAKISGIVAPTIPPKQ